MSEWGWWDRMNRKKRKVWLHQLICTRMNVQRRCCYKFWGRDEKYTGETIMFAGKGSSFLCNRWCFLQESHQNKWCMCQEKQGPLSLSSCVNSLLFAPRERPSNFSHWILLLACFHLFQELRHFAFWSISGFAREYHSFGCRSSSIHHFLVQFNQTVIQWDFILPFCVS